MIKGSLVAFVLAGSHLLAQNVAGASVVGSGYKPPAPVSVAPGQIATFYVTGLSTLTGITATLQQNGNTAAPVQSVHSVPLCPDALGTPISGCGSLTAVTVQIPYELMPLCPLCANPVTTATPATLLISQNGQAIGAIELTPLADQVHVLTQCDVPLGPPTPPQPNLTGLPCQPLVTHGNGTLVTASQPANVGEALTAWVIGLGQTSPAAKTGQAGAAAASTAETFYLNFDYQVNALPVKPFTGEPDRLVPTPLFAGLSPGFVGLYQVNFAVPPQPANGTPRCTLPGTSASGANIAQSNVTVSIGGQFSFDGAGICVATQIPID